MGVGGCPGNGMTTKPVAGRKVTALICIGLLLAVGFGAASCGPSDEERAAEHLKQGKALIAKGQYKAATKELEEAAKLDIDAMEPRMLLGNTYRVLKDYDKAFAAYRAAKKVDRYVAAPHIENALTRVEGSAADKYGLGGTDHIG